MVVLLTDSISVLEAEEDELELVAVVAAKAVVLGFAFLSCQPGCWFCGRKSNDHLPGLHRCSFDDVGKAEDGEDLRWDCERHKQTFVHDMCGMEKIFNQAVDILVDIYYS